MVHLDMDVKMCFMFPSHNTPDNRWLIFPILHYYSFVQKLQCEWLDLEVTTIAGVFTHPNHRKRNEQTPNYYKQAIFILNIIWVAKPIFSTTYVFN